MGNLMLRNAEEIARELVGSGVTGAVVVEPLVGRRLRWLNERSVPSILERVGLGSLPWVLCVEWGPQIPECAVVLLGGDLAAREEFGCALRRMELGRVRTISWLDPERSARSHVFHWLMTQRRMGAEFELAWAPGVRGLDGLGISLAITTAASVGRLQRAGEA